MGDMTQQEINLYHLFSYYIKRWWLILSLTVLGLVAGFLYANYVQTPLYKSDVSLLIVASANPAASTQDTTLINNYIELLSSRRVLESVIDKQNLSISYEELREAMTVTNNKSTQVIKVSVSSEDARTSQRVLGDAVASFRQEVKRLYASDSNIQVVDDANLPNQPYNIHKELVIAAAGLAGLALSLVIIFIVYDFNLNKAKNSAFDTNKNAKVKKQPNRKRFLRIFSRSMQSALFGDVSKINARTGDEEKKKEREL